ncbi:MAG TPA: hypothetical protein PLL95_17795, partial [Anaerolineales bacterium]|nr:hypothetical protein [Anaerolineales bacterium]
MTTRPPVPRRIRILQYLMIAVVALASFGMLISPLSLNPNQQTYDIGEVTQSSIRSPRDIEYVSEIRTEEARKAAESAVQSVYSPPDPSITRGQIERLRTSLLNISAIRDNKELTSEEMR